MTRAYLLRLLLWSMLVLGIAYLGLEWSIRVMPRPDEPMMSLPPRIEPPHKFPWLHHYVVKPIAWLRDDVLFVVELVILILIARGKFGQYLGVPDLFLADNRWVRLVNGVLFGLTAGNAIFVAYVVNQEALPWTLTSSPTLYPVPDSPGAIDEATPVRHSGQLMLQLWLPVLVLMGIGRFRGVPWISLGLALSVLFAVGFVLGGWHVLNTDWLGNWRGWFAFTPGAVEGRIPRDGFVMHAIATGFTILPFLLIVGLSISSAFGQPGSPVWVCALSLWLFNATYGFISFHFEGLQFLMLAALILVIIVANAWHPYKLKLPGLEPEYQAARAGQPKPLGVTESIVARPVPLLKGEAVLKQFCERWQAAHPDGSKPKLIVMCTSGGGIRASLWTAHVLESLEQHIGPKFQHHLRLITGASGGMVAAALYAGKQVHPLPMGLADAEVLARDSLWSTWQGFFFQDLPGVVLPFYRRWDRAHSLEASWKRHALPAKPNGRSALSTTFAELHRAEQLGLAPSLVFSPLMVEDGRRLLISNLDLSDLASESATTLNLTTEGQLALHNQRISQPAVEFFRLFPKSHDRFQVCTAARLSATFPYVSPAVSLPTSPARRLVDAGFFDNYGVGLAASWLLRYRHEVLKYCSGLAVLEVRAFPLEAEKTGLPEGGVYQPEDWLSTVIAGLSTPAEALGAVQSAGAYYRNDQLLGVLETEFNQPGQEPFFLRVPLECAGNGSLSWAVNQRDREDIRSQLDHCQPALRGLKLWFGHGGA